VSKAHNPVLILASKYLPGHHQQSAHRDVCYISGWLELGRVGGRSGCPHPVDPIPSLHPIIFIGLFATTYFLTTSSQITQKKKKKRSNETNKAMMKLKKQQTNAINL
jgi:hypothetical protein